MDFNCYLIESMVRARLGEARRAAARYALLEGLRPERPSLRLALGTALMRAGRRLAGERPAPDRLSRTA